MNDMAMKYEDWLRGCVHHDGEIVYLPCDIVLAIADWIEAHRDVAPVRHGRWKPFDRTWGRSVFTCTACGDAMDVPTEMGEPIFDYCPNCGAKMDGGEEDE